MPSLKDVKMKIAGVGKTQQITKAIENTPKLFPQAPMVACQGVEGAYSQIACEHIFKNPFILYFKNSFR